MIVPSLPISKTSRLIDAAAASCEMFHRREADDLVDKCIRLHLVESLVAALSVLEQLATDTAHRP